jgi:hypothetical protein
VSGCKASTLPTPATDTTPVTVEPVAGELSCAAGGSPTWTSAAGLMTTTPSPVRNRSSKAWTPYKPVVSQENVAVQLRSSLSQECWVT